MIARWRRFSPVLVFQRRKERRPGFRLSGDRYVCAWEGSKISQVPTLKCGRCMIGFLPVCRVESTGARYSARAGDTCFYCKAEIVVVTDLHPALPEVIVR